MPNMTPWLMVAIAKQVICCLEFCFSKKPHWQGGSKHGWGTKKDHLLLYPMDPLT
jgi:hypothetical protein